jgi:hypothetical protein
LQEVTLKICRDGVIACVSSIVEFRAISTKISSIQFSVKQAQREGCVPPIEAKAREEGMLASTPIFKPPWLATL